MSSVLTSAAMAANSVVFSCNITDHHRPVLPYLRNSSFSLNLSSILANMPTTWNQLPITILWNHSYHSLKHVWNC